MYVVSDGSNTERRQDMNDKTDGSPRDYAKEQPEPSKAARQAIAALGYGLRTGIYGDAWALELNGFLHSDWMNLSQVEAFAAGIDRTLWHLGLDEAVYRVADREEAADKTYKTETADKTDKTEKTDKYDGPCDHCDCCKANTDGNHHDVTMFHQHFIEWADDVMDDMIRTFNLDSKEE